MLAGIIAINFWLEPTWEPGTRPCGDRAQMDKYIDESMKWAQDSSTKVYEERGISQEELQKDLKDCPADDSLSAGPVLPGMHRWYISHTIIQFRWCKRQDSVLQRRPFRKRYALANGLVGYCRPELVAADAARCHPIRRGHPY